MVNNSSQLAGVDDVFNAVLIKGDATGDVVFYGKGAGKLPTASAVVADVIDCSNHLERRKDFGWGGFEEDYVIDYLDRELALYVRANAENASKDIETLREAFGKITVLNRDDAPKGEIAFVTPVATERELRKQIESVKSITPISIIRIADC
ncbi:MAG: hypothetical protein RSD42_01580 [Oscillospiraceae bacterium]